MKITNRVRRNGSAVAAAHQAKNQRAKYPPAEFKIVHLRECAVDSPMMDNPEQVVSFWRQHVAPAPWFKPERECAVVFLLNARYRLIGFECLAQGTLDTLLLRPPEVFRLAAMQAAAAIAIAHNHPSGDPSPSEGDIKVTRNLIRAAEFLQIKLLDHVIVGDARRERGYCSLRALGYFREDCECERPEADAAAEAHQVQTNGKKTIRLGPFTQREAAVLREVAANVGQVPPRELDGIALDLERQARDYRTAAKVIRRTRSSGSWAAIVVPHLIRSNSSDEKASVSVRLPA